MASREIVIPGVQPSRNRSTSRVYDAAIGQRLIASLLEIIAPTGSMMPTLSQETPGDGWLLMNGQTVVTDEFPTLARVLGETGETFILPDVTECIVVASPNGEVGKVIGENNITLTPDQMPVHTHDLTLAAHRHAITDPGHGHVVNDLGHGHAVTDPGHDHTSIVPSANDATAGADVPGVAAGNTGTNTTGITVDDALTGITINSSPTGITETEDEAPSGTLGEAGGSAPLNLLPRRLITRYWIIKT